MIDTLASRQGLNGRLLFVSAMGLALAALPGLACGLQAHPGKPIRSAGPGVTGPGVTAPSGGQPQETGGQTVLGQVLPVGFTERIIS